MDNFFHLLLCNNININNVENTINKLSDSKLSNLIEESISLISEIQHISESRYNFSTNSELGGGIFPCSSPGCRIKNIDKLSRFAILFADSVVIENPLEKFINVEVFSAMHRRLLISDLKLLFYMRPLLDSDIIKLSVTKYHFCPDCYEKLIKPNNKFNTKLETIKKSIIGECLNKVSFNYNLKNNRPKLVLSGPEEYVPHGEIGISLGQTSHSKLSTIINTNLPHTFTKDEIRNCSVFDDVYFSLLFDDIINQNWMGRTFKTQYVTNRDLDFKVLKKINDSSQDIQSTALMNGISHSVPYIYNANLDKLIELRKSEEDSFLVYRDSIQRVIREKNISSQEMFREAFNDIIAPELNKINKIVHQSEAKLLKGLKQDLIIGSGLITAAFFASFLPANIPSIISALGGLGYFHQFGQKALELLEEPCDALTNDYYFLWKVKDIC